MSLPHRTRLSSWRRCAIEETNQPEDIPRLEDAAKGAEEFTYQSPLSGVFLLWWCGWALCLFAGYQLQASLASGLSGVHLIADLVYLLLNAYGATLFFGAADVEIFDGQIRFRRVFRGSKLVPLKSIARVRRFWMPRTVCVRVDYAGNHYRFIFAASERFGRTPPVLLFLQEICKRNASVQFGGGGGWRRASAALRLRADQARWSMGKTDESCRK
jgi:hypothetical protein